MAIDLARIAADTLELELQRTGQVFSRRRCRLASNRVRSSAVGILGLLRFSTGLARRGFARTWTGPLLCHLPGCPSGFDPQGAVLPLLDLGRVLLSAWFIRRQQGWPGTGKLCQKT